MGLKLPSEQWGEGEVPLLMLHGFTHNRTAWRELAQKLGAPVRAVAVDLPGHGEAPLPSRTGREGFDETLDALERLVRSFGRPADLLGYSQGARVALALAVRVPRLVRRLVLESVNPGLKRRKDRVARREHDEVLAASIERAGVAAFLDRWEAQPLLAGLQKLPEPERQELRARREAATPEGLAGALRCLGLGVHPSYWEALPKLRVPTLLLTGARDLKFTEIARRMVRELPEAWHRAFAGCGHAPHLEAPVEYAAEVRSFLQIPWTEHEHVARAALATAAHDAPVRWVT